LARWSSSVTTISEVSSHSLARAREMAKVRVVGLGPEKFGRCLAGTGQDLLGLRARGEDAVQVRPTPLHVAGHGVDGLPCYLGAARPVEIHDTPAVVGSGQRRELLADGLDVEGALHKPSHRRKPLARRSLSGEDRKAMLT
jgi:hypothetical protein